MKAEKSLGESSTVVRGAMVQKVPSLDKAGVELKRLDGEFVCLFVVLSDWIVSCICDVTIVL